MTGADSFASPPPVPEGVAALLAVARRQGVVSVDNLPFYHEVPGEAAVLLVHGFSASPWEMRGLGQYLAAAGFTVLGVRLSGHGSTPEDLGGTSWQQWLQSVADGYALLAGQGKRIYGVGQSAGALLLICLSLQRPLAGLVLLSPFLRLRHPLAPLAGWLRHFYPSQRRKIDPALASYYYDRRPLVSIAEVVRLLRRIRRLAPEVTAPTLLFSAKGDQTGDPDSAIELFRLLGGYPRRLHLFGTDVPHVLTTTENPRQHEVFALTADFLRHLEGRSPA
jgi:carboxylesterase